MPSLDLYKKMLGSYGVNDGQAHKAQSDQIMNATWWEDIQSKVGYIYDYYHDDEPLIWHHLHSDKSKTKTPIDVKFIVNAYNSENKDQVGYHIQFRPGQKCPLRYYDETFANKYQSEFPIGCYIDLPDEQGIYRKWIICENANWLGNQFPTWYVLPIDHLFQWIHKGLKYQMCGVGRSQNSYNSGVWQAYILQSVENQRKCILPMNDISETIFYDTRIAISAPLEEPVVWTCTKVEQVSPKGISHLTFAQDKWDEHKDFIEKDEYGNVMGIWCDYYTPSQPEPQTPEETEPITTIYSKITYTGTVPSIKVGGSYKTFTVTFYKQNEPIAHQSGHWTYTVDGVDVSSLLTFDASVDSNQTRFRFADEDEYIDKMLVLSYITDDGKITSSLEVGIVGL